MKDCQLTAYTQVGYEALVHYPNAHIAHQRRIFTSLGKFLLIFLISLFAGAQPIVNRAGSIALSVNGEIYNHLELLDELKENSPDIHKEFTTDSDCEILLHLFKVRSFKS